MSDLNEFYSYRSDPDITKYQDFDVMTIAESEAFIHQQKEKVFGVAGEWVQYGIENKDTGKIIGDCAIKLDEHDVRIAEIGITVSPSEQKKGYAKEVLITLVEFLFSTQNICRIVEIVDVDNMPSIRLLESVGFRREGHFIENIFFKGRWGSEFQYAMLKREWDERKGS